MSVTFHAFKGFFLATILLKGYNHKICIIFQFIHRSFDDISSATSCTVLTELSVDGNPLANDPDHRSTILFYLTQLVTLSQQPVTVRSLFQNLSHYLYIFQEEERKEATLSAREEELKLSELQKQLKLIVSRQSY